MQKDRIMVEETEPREFGRMYKGVSEQDKQRLLRFRAKCKMKKLSFEGVRWDYFSAGIAEDCIIFLTGVFGNAEFWFPYLEAFESDYKVIAPEYPVTHSVEALVTGIREIMNVEKVAKASVVGHSFGGALAQLFVRRFPGRIKSLALAYTLAPVKGDTTVRRKWSKDLRLAVRILGLYPWRLIAWGIPKKIMSLIPSDYRNSDKAKLLKAIYREYVKYRSSKDNILCNYRYAREFFEKYEFSEAELSNWKGNILILESFADTAVKSEARELLKSIYPQAEKHVSDAGHWSLFLNDECEVSLLKSFLG